ncbi:hypothetical protein AXG93_1129s1100 [Marchantia polymorpha subsp. ruderalis]|uniref:EF-hand domain-containing protein n=1 Tax=Marchantia polymorpha subsp. ruderalis TaxID=1480154 RepID=A0A176W2G6_MARPO|nr:hypothetical protein AXG93_1129s1100 [Marchantia polymorpha subsp. ruderalis]
MAAVHSQMVLSSVGNISRHSSSRSIQSVHFEATRFASYATEGCSDDEATPRSYESGGASSMTWNAAEMKRVFEKDEAVSMLESVDSNGDGRVDFQEFLSLYRSLCDGDAATPSPSLDDEEDETLLEAFRVFDKNMDGFITAEELQTVLLDLGLPEGKSLKNCERMIQSVDVDGNGEIDLREFKEMMSSNYIYCEV